MLDDLERQVAEDRRNGFAPFMVIGTAGTTAAGVIDPLPRSGAFANRAGLWFHVDAAWGGAPSLARLRHHLAGIEAADSITCDAHKWLSVPMGCGMFFCRHRDSVAEAFRADVSYMPGKTDGPGLRSVHDIRAVVAAVYRSQALSWRWRSTANQDTPR